MPLDIQAKTSLEKRKEAGIPGQHEVTPEEARRMQEAQPRIPGPEIGSIADIKIQGTHGNIPIRIYTPEGTGPFPIAMWFHGGGWVIGNIETNDSTCRALAKESESIIISVDYKLAPENKFPIPFDDCYEATCWAYENAHTFNGNEKKLAVAGASAGGNLAAAVSLKARDENRPSIIHQTLVYPVTDYNFSYSSYEECKEGYGLEYDTMVYFWDSYLSKAEDQYNPYAVPMRASTLNNLPPAFILTVEYDPLRDEGEAYATALEAANVKVKYSLYEGMIHAFFNAGVPFDKTWDAISEVCSELKKAFGTT
tara:strand:- start:2288 stop:3217 length:930 start_codon:yes stop_codon:yes gene_type:complete